MHNSTGHIQLILQDYVCQILSALQVLHASDIVHRGLNPRCIGLIPRDDGLSSKLVKVFKVGYYVRLLDLHRSDPFGFNSDPRIDDPRIPDGW